MELGWDWGVGAWVTRGGRYAGKVVDTKWMKKNLKPGLFVFPLCLWGWGGGEGGG